VAAAHAAVVKPFSVAIPGTFLLKTTSIYVIA
jgi:hypothetical protein